VPDNFTEERLENKKKIRLLEKCVPEAKPNGGGG